MMKARRLALALMLFASPCLAGEPNDTDWHTDGFPVYVAPQHPFRWWHAFIAPADSPQNAPKRSVTLKAVSQEDAADALGRYCREQLGFECQYYGFFEGPFTDQLIAQMRGPHDRL